MKKFLLIRTILLTLFLSIGIYYEKSYSIRGIALCVIAFFLIIEPAIDNFIKKVWKTTYAFTFVFQLFLIFLLNLYSRFTLNIIFISCYMIVVIETFFIKDEKNKIIQTSIISAGFLFLNFIFVFPYGVNYEIIVEMIFLEIVLILLSVTLFLLKSYLLEKSKVVNLTKIAERAELASAIHDTIGHRLTGLIMEMEMIKLLNKSSGEINEKRDLMMDDATENAREVLKSLRVLVSSLNENNKEEITYDYLNEKIQEFSFRTGIKIDFICNFPFDNISGKIKNDIYRTIIEAITNSAKHSNTKKIDIKINVLEKDGLTLNIYDYGKVENVISEGNGINFMRKRIDLLGGEFFYKADKTGFKITIKLREVYDD